MDETLSIDGTGAVVDVRDAEAPTGFDFRIVKRRFGTSYTRLEVPAGRRTWFIENLLLDIANAGPEGAEQVAARCGYRFDDGPSFPATARGQLEVTGRLVPTEIVKLPRPAQHQLG